MKKSDLTYQNYLEQILDKLTEINQKLDDQKRIEEFITLEVESEAPMNKKLEPYG